MALPFHALSVLKPYLKGSCLSLGYPDLMVNPKHLPMLFEGYTPTKFTNAHIWHKLKKPFPETRELFDFLGMKLTVVDFKESFGVDIVADLNHPHDFGEYDLVIDPGTLEHCFNFGQAFINAAASVKDGGTIFHLSPMTMLNHGFFNLNPTLFYDFYSQNGWNLVEAMVHQTNPHQTSLTGRFDMHQEYLLRVLAIRTPGGSLKFPIQNKYLKAE